MGSWNVRSLVESEGHIQTAAASGIVADDKKIYQIVQHLECLEMDAAALQETHWFGQENYQVHGAMVIASGRPVPGEGAPRRRGEGVAFVLRGNALRAWREGGCQLVALSAFDYTLESIHESIRMHSSRSISCHEPWNRFGIHSLYSHGVM